MTSKKRGKDFFSKKKGRRPQKKKGEKRKTTKKQLLSIPLKFRGKPFLGLAQLSKIFTFKVTRKFLMSQGCNCQGNAFESIN